MGLDLLSFSLPESPRAGMSGYSDPVKLRWTAALCLSTALITGLNAWAILRPASPHKTVADRWSPWATLVWWAAALIGLLVYYPLPYANHHIDRFLLILLLTLGWGLWLLVHPVALGRALESRPYHGVRIAAINLLLFLILAEGAVRLGEPLLTRSGLFSATAGTPGGGIPHQAVCGSDRGTNSLGFRDRERTLDRTSSALRLVVLGDSFTWGSGVRDDEMFVGLVEQSLAQAAPGAEVVNLGLVGYQPEEYLSLLKSHGMAYHPNFVLVNFYIGNDFMPTWGEQLIVAGQRHRVHVNGNWFHDHLSTDHWHLAHYLEYALVRARVWIWQAQGDVILGTCPGVLAERSADSATASFPGWSPRYLGIIQGGADLFLKRDTPGFLERWQETRAALEALDALLRERGVAWALVLLPAEEQVEPELQRLLLEKLKVAPDEYDFDKPQRLLGEWGRSRGVRVIDLLPFFRANGEGRRLYITSDVHWNRHGHALAAEAILLALRPILHEHGRLTAAAVAGGGTANASEGH